MPLLFSVESRNAEGAGDLVQGSGNKTETSSYFFVPVDFICTVNLMIWFCTDNENEEEPKIIEIVDPDAEVF